MKTSSAKAKGRKLQYIVAKRICSMFNLKFDNFDDLSPIKSRTMGLSGTDIVIQNKEIQDKFPFDIECKNTEKLSLYPTIEQAKSNTKKNHDWLVVHKRNRKSPIVILDFEVFMKLIEKIIKECSYGNK